MMLCGMRLDTHSGGHHWRKSIRCHVTLTWMWIQYSSSFFKPILVRLPFINLSHSHLFIYLLYIYIKNLSAIGRKEKALGKKIGSFIKDVNKNLACSKAPDYDYLFINCSNTYIYIIYSDYLWRILISRCYFPVICFFPRWLILQSFEWLLKIRAGKHKWSRSLLLAVFIYFH